MTVLGASERTAEEFHGWCRQAALTLREAAIGYAAAGQRVSALADAWASDVAAMQAVIWGRLVIASHSPQRIFFQTAEPIANAVATAPAPRAGDGPSCADLVVSARSATLAAFSDELAASVREEWPDVAYLEQLPAPTTQDVAAWTTERLGGQSADAFVAGRQQLARDRMADAQLARMRGNVSEAVTAAYEADYRILEAYLVESSIACGDVALLTACSRSDLVTAALATLPSLPGDFLKATLTIRHVIAQALGEADGDRFERALLDPQRAG